MNKSEKFSMLNPKNQRKKDFSYTKMIDKYWDNSIGSNVDKLKSFTKYVPFSEFPKFLAKYEIFKKIITVNGSIIECGVHQGSGLMTWALLSSIFEPVNHLRKIFGFDTFEGFPALSKFDEVENNLNAKIGGLSVNSHDDILESIKIYDTFRPLGHISKVKLIKGDANKTIEYFITKNPHLIISLLYLDFDIYKPTKKAIEKLRKRMPKGAIIAFDELNHEDWPGETVALMETLGINNLKIERFPFHPQISYAILD